MKPRHPGSRRARASTLKLDPALHGSMTPVGVSGPDKRLAMFRDTAVGGGVAFDDRAEYAPLQPPPCHLRKQGLGRIEPGAQFWGEGMNAILLQGTCMMHNHAIVAMLEK